MLYNFSAGPAMLPKPVLLEAQRDMLSYDGTSLSVLEMSHRSEPFLSIRNEAEQLVRDLLFVPDDYEVLFLQGGATLQFAMVPMNLAPGGRVDFIETGLWSERAFADAACVSDAHVVASSKADAYQSIPTLPAASDAAYVHLTLNNTLEGTRFTSLPDVAPPLVADASSCLFSEPIDVSRFGLIYAGAQKNIGPAGLTLVIVRKELLRAGSLPSYLRYDLHAKNDSLYNTPPTYSLYLSMLVLRWIKQTGVGRIHTQNKMKAKLLYETLDASNLFHNRVLKKDRSLMNVPFSTGDEERDASFLRYAKEHGLINLEGHRSVGGMRASIYNAMPLDGVEALCAVINRYEKEMS
ncbi:3-phosphoserine/phosphohydroxythreonine transaminase [Exiguobacterium flavidum]|uniref:3-phosphoserine/phosphohydroxythreonine transaminase n=1 Tax=Exiguobacterium flavidum TaxID=2184695 RepID=UPI0022B7DD11|nr:3-phosphoserine/phosphohydroxythreonine transaminase [Exiguobacterium flavidum]